DLDGAKAGYVKNWKVLEKIAANTSLQIDFSGGLSSIENVTTAFNTGARFVAIGSLAVKNEMLLLDWLSSFGAGKFIIGADVKDEVIVIKGWTEKTALTVFDLIETYKLKGVKKIFCTDVGKDGMMQGPATDLYKKIMNQHPSIDLIASGGISRINDLDELREAGCDGAIIGKAIYENKITLKELKRFL
ncbi:MAG: HisA/HisF-related TIM barrel protein, partial [Chitinophagaceae bacterium]